MAGEKLAAGSRAISRRDALALLAATAAGMSSPAQAQAPSPHATKADTAAMQTKKIPSSGAMLPVIGMGTWQTFDVGTTSAERGPLQEVLQEFAALGGKLIDSSPMYGKSEMVAGDLIARLGLRDKLFIATKVWTSGQSAGVAQMRESMQRLRAKPIDLMQVHNLLDVNTQLATLRQWKSEGLVRYIGVTHYTASAHEALSKLIRTEAVDFIQINYSIGEREAEERLLPLAAERGVAVIANRPFAGGNVFGRLRSKPLPPWAADIDCSSWAQLLLKFVVSHPAITCAIPATSKAAHLRDNMQAGLGRMPEEKLRALIAAQL
jgi:diketogulonate reductase-like aldo/keto reductase